MAMTYQEALKKAQESAMGAGVDINKIGIDPGYVKAIQEGTLQQYGENVLSQAIANKLPTNIVQPTRTVTRSEDRTSSMQNQLADQLAQAQKQKAVSSLEQAYQRNLSGLKAEQEKVDPLFAEQRRQAVTQGIIGKKSFSDFLAEKGLSSSGLAGQGELSQNIALQGQLGGIESQRVQNLADIERRRALLGQDLAYGTQQAQAGIDIQQLENQMRLQEQLRQEQLRTQQQAEAQAREDFGATIGANYNDLMAYANRLRAEGAPEWQVNQVLSARQGKIQEQGLDQYGRPIQQAQAATPLNQSTALAMWKSLGTANESIAKALGIPVGTRYSAPAKSTSGGTTKTATFP